MTDWRNKTVLVTGAGSGLGRALCLLLAKSGAEVILLGRKKSRLEDLYDEIVENSWTEPAIQPFDLAQAHPDSIQALAHGVARLTPQLDAVFHCAGALGSLTPLSHYPPDQWLRVFMVNCHAPFLLTQSLLPLLKASESGQVTFMLDKKVDEPHAFWGAYAASKAALKQMAGILSLELMNTSVQVKTFRPEPMATALRMQAYPGDKIADLATPDSQALLCLEM